MYIKITNGVPENYTIGQLRRDNPNVSFPKNVPTAILEQHGVYPCTVDEQPAYLEKTQRLEQGGFTQDDQGNWTRGWAIVDKTQQEIDDWVEAKAAEVRNRRGRLLAETDYLALTDNTLTPEIATYRQALRDITTQPEFPENVTWPTKPE